MLLIPAIDLKDGHCVRLKQGDMDDATVFSEDPAAMARHWLAQGARRLHLVDDRRPELRIRNLAPQLLRDGELEVHHRPQPQRTFF